MNRIQTLFAAAKASGKKIFTAYLTMGFPDMKYSERAVETLIDNGVDNIPKRRLSCFRITMSCSAADSKRLPPQPNRPGWTPCLPWTLSMRTAGSCWMCSAGTI